MVQILDSGLEKSKYWLLYPRDIQQLTFYKNKQNI